MRRESIVVDWIGADDEAVRAFRGVAGVASVDAAGGVIQIAVDDAAAVAPRLFEAAPRGIVGLRIRAATLEDAYFQYVARNAGAVEEEVRT
jgi:hypothetical protein